MSEVQLKEKLKEVIYKSRKMVLLGQDWNAVMTICGVRWKTSAQGAKGVDKMEMQQMQPQLRIQLQEWAR